MTMIIIIFAMIKKLQKAFEKVWSEHYTCFDDNDDDCDYQELAKCYFLKDWCAHSTQPLGG